MGSLRELLSLAQSQTSYEEKHSAYMLDDFHANAGSRNYTKYSRDVNNWGLMGCQGQPWCATYQFWLEAKVFGVDTALSHFCMDRSNYQGYNCFSIYHAFGRKGRTSDKPEPGCLVIFKHSHIGRVTGIRSGRIYTNEGNTSALYGDSNGGTVKNKDYAVSDSTIQGYCLIDYGGPGNTENTGNSAVTDTPAHKKPDVVKERVKSYQCWLNTWYCKLLCQYCGGCLEEDGVYGEKTRKASLAVWKDILNRLYGCSLSVGSPDFGEKCRNAAARAVIKNGSTGTLPAIAEGILAAKGFYRGNIDAVFGNGMETAVRSFQKAQGLEIDGIIGKETWRRLLK